MEIIDTEIKDVKILKPQVFGDERGFFMETWRDSFFRENVADKAFVQDNHSKSTAHVLRGLHYQLSHPQGKLVRVVQGEVFDVAVDIRKSSPTFGKYVGVRLSSENKLQFWIPEGFAHGFCVISEGVMMASIMITGGAGFIGSNFAHYWLEKYPEDKVVVLDALTYAGNLDNLADLDPTRCEFVHGNIADTSLVEYLLKTHGIRTIVNFAAESHVDRSISDPDIFIETNIVGTYNLLKAAKHVWLDGKDTGAHRFHHVSTDEVYGTLAPGDRPFAETNKYLPNSPYSASKASSDHLVRAFHRTYGLDVTISNCSNNYGYFHNPEKLIPLTLTNILRGRTIPVYGDGAQIRDWLFVMDHCRGIDLILKKGKVGESYNIGGINEWKNIDIVNLICKTLDDIFAKEPSYKEEYPESVFARGGKAEDLIEHVTDRLGHDRRYAIDPTKMDTELGYRPATKFEDGIRMTIVWYLKHHEWWKKLVK